MINRIKLSAALCIGAITQLAFGAHHEGLGDFAHHHDVGNPDLSGSASFDSENQVYTLSGSGINMWATSDQFQFAYNQMEGDFIIRATVEFVGEGVDPHRKIGIMARNSLDTDSAYADACVHGDTLSSLQYRTEKGGETDQVVLDSYHPTEIELQREGDLFTFSAARFGETYKSVSKEIDLNDELYVGLFICSHNAEVMETARFSNVRVVIPAATDFQPYRDYIGSRLEIMDVHSGHRKVLHNAPNSIQAPNWTIDGKTLIYNSEGKLYNYDLASGSISELNTGFADQNNNDHVLSFDGSQMAISHHLGDARTSTLYTLPVSGSDNPRQITDPANGHSFLHGWTPDAKKLIFTGQRNDQWNIWTIDIETKKEVALTNNNTLDDGPEYTPDGKYVYFNSVRTGTMQIWRMKADGSEQEQVTFDAYNDWFPHFSPDGKWMVYISFPVDIDPNDHPFYKKVYLRLMPASGGVPKTIAYLYGGQGTINVPSWSPDSSKIAFVSNTQFLD
ncbi:hypothetical protein VDG1235_3165 [Verrucomicrobiia bacterium DG1235]|nr:hypothetical protein VDG1235_3165 [Verrucomicrobiae bacterium DG1235]